MCGALQRIGLMCASPGDFYSLSLPTRLHVLTLKVPQKINNSLIEQINKIKEDLNEAEKLKVEAKNLLSDYESNHRPEFGGFPLRKYLHRP